MKRICSRRNDLIVNVYKLQDWFRVKGYHEEIVNKDTKTSISGSRNKSKQNTQVNSQKAISLVVTDNPFLYPLGKSIGKYLFLLYQDDEVTWLLTPALVVSFRSARTLKNHLVRAKVYPTEEMLIESKKCLGNHCQVCKNVADILWTKKFIRLITDLHAVINAWCIYYDVKFVDVNILVKL